MIHPLCTKTPLCLYSQKRQSFYSVQPPQIKEERNNCVIQSEPLNIVKLLELQYR